MSNLPEPGALVRLDALIIHRFRNVRPGTSVRFDAQWNVLLGVNGAGKTTLLKLLSALAASNVSAFKAEEYDIEFSIQIGRLARVECRLRNELPLKTAKSSKQEKLAGLLAAENGELRLSADAKVFTEAGRAPIQVEATTTSVKVDGHVRPDAVIRPYWLLQRLLLDARESLPTPEDEELRERLMDAFVLLYSATESLWRFDEGLATFDQLVGAERYSAGLGERLRTRSKLAFSRESGGDPIVDYIHSDFVSKSTMAAARGRCTAGIIESPPESIVLPSDELEFLKKAVRLFGFENGELQAQLELKDVGEQQTIVSYSPFLVRFMRHDKSIIRHDHLSYGQKRMLAFLYYADANQHIVFADELVNGLHHGWIVECIDEIRRVQKFLTSQNPLLLDHLQFESVEQVETRFIRCSIVDGQMQWANLDGESAKHFFFAYSAGIQYVGEILRTEGLW